MNAVTLKKAWQDGENLYHHARAVIVINEQGEVLEVKNKVSGSLVNVLAVLGPIKFGDECVMRAVRAEIGIERTSPYKIAERNLNGQVFKITKRIVLQSLSNSEELLLLPTIEKLLQGIIDAEVMHRKSLTYWKSRKSDAPIYVNGKFITIPKNLPIFMFACLAKDMHIKMNGHLSEFATISRLKLGRLRFAGYSPRQLRQINAAQEIAEILGEAKYGEYVLEIIRKKIGRIGSKSRALFEQIIEEFNIKPFHGKDTEYLMLREMYGSLESRLLTSVSFSVNTHQKRIKKKVEYFKKQKQNKKRKMIPYSHAVDCVRVEVAASPEAVKLHASCIRDIESID